MEQALVLALMCLFNVFLHALMGILIFQLLRIRVSFVSPAKTPLPQMLILMIVLTGLLQKNEYCRSRYQRVQYLFYNNIVYLSMLSGTGFSQA